MRPPEEVLGIDAGADAATIRSAWRALAKVRHPDAGGSVEAMQELNEAATAALAAVAAPGEGTIASNGDAVQPRPRRRPDPRPRPGFTGVRRDHPSFTIEALPAVAFEALLVAAGLIGEVVGDDPPYLMQVVLSEPAPCWSQLEMVPDAGSTSVTLTVARLPGNPGVDVDEVRDVWIETLNRLDWQDPDAPRLPY